MPDSILELLIDRIHTPLGELLLVVDEVGRVRALDWSDYEFRMLRLLSRHYGRGRFKLRSAHNPHQLRDVIDRYFTGEMSAICRVAVQTGGTPFQRTVWDELRKIPPGTVISYATLAARIERPKAVRAVGMANGANPIGLVVPCHRVIGTDGSLTGYGGGLKRKQWLLEHERKFTATKR